MVTVINLVRLKDLKDKLALPTNPNQEAIDHAHREKNAPPMSLNRDKENSVQLLNLRESPAKPMFLSKDRDRSVLPTKPQ